jgi:type III restriction enzyme
MSNPFFDHPILNSPYEYPQRHWELDDVGQPTQKIIEHRRSAKFITPIPKPKKRKAPTQTGFVFDEGKGLSTKEQQYDPTSIINEVRGSREVNLGGLRIGARPRAWPASGDDTRSRA